MHNRLRAKLTRSNAFVFTVELVPSRGVMRKDIDEVLEFTEKAYQYGRIDALSFTDNPGGNPRLSPDVLGRDVIERGMAPLIHLACKDFNRNAVESRAFQLDRIGVENVLALTGDFPKDGFQGMAKPSFDLDSVSMIRMLSEMNRGFRIPARKPGKYDTLEPTDFFVGACVSPFKKLRSESYAQYFKLEKKIANGADFIITQVGYDMRKFDELKRYLRQIGHDSLPLIGNVYVPHRIVSRIMNANDVPGCVVSDKMLEWVNEQAKSEDKGRKAFLDLAAKQIAVLRGIGYRGAHIGGFGLGFDDVCMIIENSVAWSDSWLDFVAEISFSQPDEFYHFDKNPHTGLNVDKDNTSGNWIKEKDSKLSYRSMKLVHDLFFEPLTAGFFMAQKACAAIDKSAASGKTFYKFEKLVKWTLNDCQECGDCSLTELAFLCPESQCPKFQRNGACGGSFGGICELGDRPCVWTRVFNRWEPDNKLDRMRLTRPVIKNPALNKTSSWLNYYLGRDHCRHLVPPIAGKKEEN